jgi:hypothetical protein
MVAYILFLFLIKYNETMITSFFTKLFTISNSRAQEYVSNVIFATLSSFIFLFVLYFFVSSASYLWYVLWGMFSIQSAESSNILRLWYGILFIIPAMVVVRTINKNEGFREGAKGDSGNEVPSNPLDKLPPCNQASWLNQIFFLFLVPLLASLQGVLSFLKGGVIGIPTFFTDFQSEKKSIFYSVVGFGIIFFLFYTIWPLIVRLLVPNFLSAIGAETALVVYNSRMANSNSNLY